MPGWLPTRPSPRPKNTAPPTSPISAAGSKGRVHSSWRRSVPAVCTYDYAIVRVVPRVERGEFVNAGAIVSCHATGYLKARIELDETLLAALAPRIDLVAIRATLATIPL